ncbi:MAG: fluoride efflux transporter CrcB [Planctomycetia bacterium]|nr:fluoride efflux transporter CrcB [Planctomycetia bacterium]
MFLPNWLASFITHPITLLALGGGVGANARYWLGHYIGQWQLRRFERIEFPWATFAINVIGSIVLGFVASVFLNHPDPARRNWYLLLGTGFCGGFTTFSTFSLETLELMQDHRLLAATAYVCGSVVAGILGVWLALKLGGGKPIP